MHLAQTFRTQNEPATVDFFDSVRAALLAGRASDSGVSALTNALRQLERLSGSSKPFCQAEARAILRAESLRSASRSA